MGYASTKKKTPPSTPSRRGPVSAAHLVEDLVGTPAPVKPSILAHLGKVVGRNQVAYELGISKSLLDQMIEGTKNDPVIRIQRLIRIAVKYCGPEPALEIARDLIAAVGGKVIDAELVEALKKLSKVVE